jgi:hypothetical protein
MSLGLPETAGFKTATTSEPAGLPLRFGDNGKIAG